MHGVHTNVHMCLNTHTHKQTWTLFHKINMCITTYVCLYGKRCIHVYTYACIHVMMHTHPWTCLSKQVHVSIYKPCTHAHSYMQSYTPVDTQAHTYVYAHTDGHIHMTHTGTHKYMSIYTYMYIHMCAKYTYVPIYMCKSIPAHMFMSHCAHTYMYMNICMHTYTNMLIPLCYECIVRIYETSYIFTPWLSLLWNLACCPRVVHWSHEFSWGNETKVSNREKLDIWSRSLKDLGFLL